MTDEQRLLLKCLEDICSGQKTYPPDSGTDVDYFLHLAQEQSLAGIIYDQGRNWLSSVSGFRSVFLSDVFFSVNRADILREISERFQKENIPFICIKGAVFRDCYPIPELRSMGDVDIVIHTEDREKANRILMEDMGFQRMIDNHAVWTYWIGEFIFEVHDHMFYEELIGDFDYRAYFDCIWEYKKPGSVFGVESPNLFIPEENYHFLYLMTHTAKHVINKGMGFRAFLDMVFFVRARGDVLRWDWLEKELSKMSLLQFTKTCFLLCERWFNVKMPLCTGKLDEDFYTETTVKMFRDGLFGLHNANNEGAASAKGMMRSDRSYWVTALLMTGKKLFPPYEDMQLIPWYSFVDGRPWLLPAAWIYRWGYCLVKKPKSGAAKLTEPFLKKELIEKREELINNWGL